MSAPQQTSLILPSNPTSIAQYIRYDRKMFFGLGISFTDNYCGWCRDGETIYFNGLGMPSRHELKPRNKIAWLPLIASCGWLSRKRAETS